MNAVIDLMGAGLAAEVARLRQAHPCAKIELSGHSLGGALATLFAGTLLGGQNCVGLYTFGAPRSGNAPYADCFGDALDASCCAGGARVIHNDDPVPGVPPSVWPWDYEHVEGIPTVRLPEDSVDEPPRICENPEDRCCQVSSGLLELHDWHEHLDYWPEGEDYFCKEGGKLLSQDPNSDENPF